MELADHHGDGGLKAMMIELITCALCDAPVDYGEKPIQCLNGHWTCDDCTTSKKSIFLPQKIFRKNFSKSIKSFFEVNF